MTRQLQTFESLALQITHDLAFLSSSKKNDGYGMTAAWIEEV